MGTMEVDGVKIKFTEDSKKNLVEITRAVKIFQEKLEKSETLQEKIKNVEIIRSLYSMYLEIEMRAGE